MAREKSDLYAKPLTNVVWHKSGGSVADRNCVEVAFLDGGVAVRDSRRPDRPALRFTDEEWASFVSGVRAGEFDV